MAQVTVLPDRRMYTDLTQEQFDRGKEWLGSQIVNWEFYPDSSSILILRNPEQELIDQFDRFVIR